MSSLAPATKELLNRLASWKGSVRQAAVQEAKQLGPDALLDLMQQGRSRLQRRRGQRWLFFILYILGGGIAAGFTGHDAFYHWKLIHSFIMQSVWWGLLLIVAPNLKASLLSVVEDMQDATFVPHLLTLLASYGLADTPKMRTTLVRLLPRMSRQQADALTPQQRKNLLMPLTQSLKFDKRNKSTVDYVVTTLKALEQIGDKRELRLVESLASIPIHTDKDRQIQQAALECLPYLQLHVEEQKQQTTLLRPSASASSVNSEALLRASASASPATCEEQLLRATLGE